MPAVAWRRIVCPAVTRARWASIACFAALGAATGGCGDQIAVPEADRRGAVLFNERCAGCHTLTAAAARGSRPERMASGGERTDGPNFNTRKEARDDVLFAIRNGGFSGAIMPANIVVGDDAEAVAEFVAKYAGREGHVSPAD